CYRVFRSTRRRPPRSPLFPYTTLFRSLLPVPVRLLLPPLHDDLVRASSVRDRHRDRVPVVSLRTDRSLLRGYVHHLLRSGRRWPDRKSTRLNSSHVSTSYAVFCLKEKR